MAMSMHARTLLSFAVFKGEQLFIYYIQPETVPAFESSSALLMYWPVVVSDRTFGNRIEFLQVQLARSLHEINEAQMQPPLIFLR